MYLFILIVLCVHRNGKHDESTNDTVSIPAFPIPLNSKYIRTSHAYAPRSRQQLTQHYFFVLQLHVIQMQYLFYSIIIYINYIF